MAWAPETISMSWDVMAAWRLRLYMSVRERERALALSEAAFMAFMRAASSEAMASCEENTMVRSRAAVSTSQAYRRASKLQQQQGRPP